MRIFLKKISKLLIQAFLGIAVITNFAFDDPPQIELAEPVYEKGYFRSPLNIPLFLSGTFGELRRNHFHSGLDIKTNAKEGYPVFAAASGYVSRLRVQS